MALPEDNKQISEKSQSSGCQKPEKREKPPTKVVIRRLPPSIEKDSLLNQISPLPDFDYFYLVNGEAALGENSFSRAYINFLKIDDVYEFKERFDNYVFLDPKGNEYPAVVEFAPFQKIPKKRNKVRSDPKCGTIESDPFYLEFLEYLKKPKEQEDKPEYSYQFSSENKEKDMMTTPLLEFVRSRRAERMRIREERREERKKKEKKIREEEKKKRSEDKFLSKSFSKMKLDSKDISDNEERDEILDNNENKSENHPEKLYSYRNKDKKFDERKRNTKVASPRKEFVDKREFKNRKEHFKEPKADMKKEEKQVPKKAKKYSEKREERKIEAQKKAEELEKKCSNVGNSNSGSEKKEKTENESSEKIDSIDKPDSEDLTVDSKVNTINKGKETEPKNTAPKNKDISKSQKLKDPKTSESKSTESKDSNREHKKERIRNKDRPTIAIYRPGMLSKRKVTEGDDKESNKDTSSK